MTSNKNNILLFALFIITAIYYIPIINLPLAPYDEAVILVGAERILQGQIPHKDFSSEYPIGQLYTLAALFKIFGTSVLTERVYDILIKSLLSLFVFLIVRLLSSNRIALVGWLMSLVWLQHSSFPAYPVYPAMLFIYISVYLLLRYMKEQKNHYVMLSAVSIMFAVLFRHDLGGYAAIVMTMVLLVRSMAGVQSWSPLLLFIGCGITAALPIVLYFFMTASIGFLYNDLILIPLAFLDKQALPYPSFSRWNLPFFMFPAVLVIGAITSMFSIKRDKHNSRAYAVLTISCIGIFCFNQVRVRSDIVHLIPVALTAILLAPILLYTLPKELSLNTWLTRVGSVFFIIIFGITLSKPVEVIIRLLHTTNGYTVEKVSPDMERSSYLSIDSNLKDAVVYIKNNTAKKESIYVGVINHDQFVFNDAIIYFLSERTCATRYHILNPGVQTTKKVQEEMVSEFINSPPKLIVLSTRFRSEPNLSSVDTHVNLLDNYILTNFELKKTFGIYELWMRKL